MSTKRRQIRRSGSGCSSPFGVFVILYLALVLSLVGSPAPVSGESAPVMSAPPVKPLPEFYRWGTFESGAWRYARTVLEQPDSQAGTRTVTQSHTVLRERTEETVQTVMESVVTLAGKSVKTDPKIFTCDFWGIPIDATRRYRVLTPETLLIEDVPVECTVLQIDFSSKDLDQTTTLWYNDTRSPFVFQRHTRIVRVSDNVCCEETRMRVTSMNLQVLVLGKIQNGYRFTQTSRFPDHTAEAQTVACPRVPGGVVTRMTVESDLSGGVRQTMTTELLDYGFDSSDRQKGMYRDNVVRSDRLISLPPRSAAVTEKNSEPQTREFSLEFTAEEPGAKLSEKLSEELNFSSLAAFCQRWYQMQNRRNEVVNRSLPGGELVSELFLSPDENSELEVRVEFQGTRSPMYNAAYRHMGIEVVPEPCEDAASQVISTQTLRSRMGVGTFPNLQRNAEAREKNRENIRNNWRRAWRQMWNGY